VTCVQLFAEYLFEASKSLTEHCYYELCVFVVALKYTFEQVAHEHAGLNQVLNS